MRVNQSKSSDSKPFWNQSAQQLMMQLESTEQGLASSAAELRLARDGANRLNGKKTPGAWLIMLRQFKSSIILLLLLLLATGISFYLHDRTDALIILTIVLVSGLLGFWQEKGAANAVEKLLAMVAIKVTVLRDETLIEVPNDSIVVGDVVTLKAGDIVPADCLLISADNLFIDEAALTGESFPAEKMPGILTVDTPLSQRTNALWMGTHVQSGTAHVLIVATKSRLRSWLHGRWY